MYFAFHGSLDNSKSIGTNKLIKNGAMIVTSPQDIIEKYSFLEKREGLCKNCFCENDTDKQEEIEEEYKEIYKIVTKEGTDINDIVKTVNAEFNEVVSKLTMLELDGKILKMAGNKYKKA